MGSSFLAIASPQKLLLNAKVDPSSVAPAADDRRVVKVSGAMPSLSRQALMGILQNEAMDGAEVSFMAYDLNSKEVLASSGADRLINPASNAKLITSAAALHLLGPEFRWETEYHATAPIVDGILNGDLIVKGSGDPTVVNERLASVADALYAKGLRKITGRIVVDDSVFDRNLEAKGWELEEAPDRAYAAPVSGLSLNFNAIGVQILPGKKNRPAVVRVDPPVSTAHIAGGIRTGSWVRRLRVGTEKHISRGDTLVTVSGQVGYRDGPRKIYRRIYNPPMYFGSAFAGFLNRRGIQVRDASVAAPVPSGARLLYVDQSPRLTEVISDLNHFSNNFIAESVIKTIGSEFATSGPGTFDAGLKEVRAFLENDVGFVPRSYVFGNGSGLNDVNRFTARQLVQLLGFMHENYPLETDFKSSLAVAGTQGTIRNRMRNGPARQRLRAKTGTLRGVSALSGYVVDPENRELAFSILVQRYPSNVRVGKIWEVQNDIGEVLASAGTSWSPGASTQVAANDAVAPLASAIAPESDTAATPAQQPKKVVHQ